MTRNNNNKLRAAFFAALMVLWVFSGAVAFGGSAVAEHANTEVDHDDTWSSSQTRWQGQQLYLDQGALSDNHSNWQLRQWDRQATSSRLGSLERELSFNSEGEAVVRTSNLETGDYVITATDGNGNRVVVQTDESGTATSSAAPSNSDSDDAYVEVVTQDLTTEFEQDSVPANGNATLNVDSNRGGYDLQVTSPDFTANQLENIFNADETPDSDTAQINSVSSNSDVTANFDQDFVEPGDYEFEFTASDTTASGNANISVGEARDDQATFDQDVYSSARGDVVEMTLETRGQVDNVTVNIGDSDIGYNTTINATPVDDEVVIRMNTWLAGQNSAEHEAFTINGEPADASQVERHSDQLSRVLGAELYDVNAEVDGSETDVAAIQLEERTMGEMTVHQAPRNDQGEFEDANTVLNRIEEGSIAEGNEIANQDLVVAQVELTGIYGAVEDAGTDDANILSTLADQGIEFSMAQTNPSANREPKTLNLTESSGALQVVSDEENGTVYIFGKSDQLAFDRGSQISGDAGAEEGDEFDMSLNATSDYLENFQRDVDDSDVESATSEFSVVERSAEFDAEGGEIVVPASENAEMTGTTTVAPGTDIRVRARATGENPFLKTARTTVQTDGTFSAEFDFSDVESEQEFVATIPGQEFEQDAETNGRVGEAAQASVSLSDVEAEGDEVSSITVDSVDAPQGGFVAIHDSSLEDGAAFDSYLGSSEYLSEGESSDVEVELDEPITEESDIFAVVYQDTNGNQEFDFVDSEGDEDATYTDENGDAIAASASVTFSDDTGNETETPTNNGTDTETETETETATEGGEDGEDEQAGFGAVIALIALLGAALLAARRNDF